MATTNRTIRTSNVADQTNIGIDNGRFGARLFWAEAGESIRPDRGGWRRVEHRLAALPKSGKMRWIVQRMEDTMTRTRAELDGMLDELDRDLRMLIMDETCNDDLWTVFAGQADAIEASAGADDIAHVQARTSAILAAQGIIPPEQAASP